MDNWEDLFVNGIKDDMFKSKEADSRGYDLAFRISADDKQNIAAAKEMIKIANHILDKNGVERTKVDSVLKLIKLDIECYDKNRKLLQGARNDSVVKSEQKLLDCLIQLYFNVIDDMIRIMEEVEGLR